jgi:hypothetical protein
MATITQTEKAIKFYKEDNIKASFRIFKTFKMGITKDEKRTIKIAHECVSGNDSFYKSLGIDCDKEISKARKIIETKFFK